MDSCGPVAKRFASPLYPFFRSSNVEAVEWMLGWGCVTLVLSLYITLNPSSSLSRTIDIFGSMPSLYSLAVLFAPILFPPADAFGQFGRGLDGNQTTLVGSAFTILAPSNNTASSGLPNPLPRHRTQLSQPLLAGLALRPWSPQIRI